MSEQQLESYASVDPMEHVVGSLVSMWNTYQEIANEAQNDRDKSKTHEQDYQVKRERVRRSHRILHDAILQMRDVREMVTLLVDGKIRQTERILYP